MRARFLGPLVALTLALTGVAADACPRHHPHHHQARHCVQKHRHHHKHGCRHRNPAPKPAPQPKPAPRPAPPPVVAPPPPVVQPPVVVPPPVEPPPVVPPPVTPPPPAGDVQPVGPAGTWKLRFQDEFSGTSLDRSKWNPMDGGNMNNVTTRASNVSVSGGQLHLQLSSKTEGAEVCSGGECGAGYALPVGGVAEARVLFPGADGEDIWNWPAWWVSGPNWPSAGEHDIAEGLGGENTINYHGMGVDRNFPAVPGAWRNAFHTYTLVRNASSADVYWDGVKVRSYATNDNGEGESLILNVGASPTRVNHTGEAGEVKVDYVRAWTP